VELYVDREVLPETAAGEFYHADLVGLAVVDHPGPALGRVVATPNLRAGGGLAIGLPSPPTRHVSLPPIPTPEGAIRGARGGAPPRRGRRGAHLRAAPQGGSPRSSRGTSPVRPAASATSSCLRAGILCSRPRPTPRTVRSTVASVENRRFSASNTPADSAAS